MSRHPANLSESLCHRLNSYALAASAAGLGMLASAHSAEAKIVYTHTRKVIPHCNPHNINLCFALDLNHDHIVDFRIRWFRSPDGAELSILPAGKNESKNQIAGAGLSASALSSGTSVGPNSGKFQGKHYRMWGWSRTGTGVNAWGKWDNLDNRYLGLKFYINGNVHYGWARFAQHWGQYELTTLTGYAYETIPNKPIITGKTHGPDVITVQLGSLGALAAGKK